MPLVQILSIALVGLLLLALVFWTVRRHRRLKYQRIKTRLRYQNVDPDDFQESYGSELPSGGARVIGTRDTEDVETVNARIRQQAEANRPKLSIPGKSPSQQASLDLGDDAGSPESTEEQRQESVPLLLDPADDAALVLPEGNRESPGETRQAVDFSEPEQSMPESEPEQPSAADSREVEIDTGGELDDPEPPTAEEPLEDEESSDDILFSDPQTVERPRNQTKAGVDPEPQAPPEPEPEPKPESAPEPVPEPVSEPEFEAQAEPEPEPEQETRVEALAGAEAAPGLESSAAQPEPEDEDDEAASPDEVIIINLMVREGNHYFAGAHIRQALERQGVKLGQMDIFHFQSDISGRGMRFSAANILNPGTFPPDQLDQFETPGICFFMTLNAGYANMEAFNKLMEVARSTAASLGGDLKDQNRSHLTGQSVEHIRSQIADYQRKLLLR